MPFADRGRLTDEYPAAACSPGPPPTRPAVAWLSLGMGHVALRLGDHKRPVSADTTWRCDFQNGVAIDASFAIAVSTLNDRPFLEVPANEARRCHSLMLPTEADKRINALVAIYRQAGYGLDHCEGNLLENHPDLLQNCGHCSKSWRASTLTLPNVAHHCSRDLILRGDIATNSRLKQDIV